MKSRILLSIAGLLTFISLNAMADSKVCINGVCKTSKSGSISVTTDSDGELVWKEGENSAGIKRELRRDLDDQRFDLERKRRTTSRWEERSESSRNVSRSCNDEGCVVYECEGKFQLRGHKATCNGNLITGSFEAYPSESELDASERRAEDGFGFEGVE